MPILENPLTFALDWDDTFTAAPELWAKFVLDAQRAGHIVIIVTSRRDDEDSRMDIRLGQIEYGTNLRAIFAEMGSKLHAVEAAGINVSVWIDDDPRALVHGR